MNNKCVIVINENLPIGLISNTAAVLGASFGKLEPQHIDKDIFDSSGQIHRGIVNIPIPILKSNQENIAAIRKTALEMYSDTIIVDFSKTAQGCNSYDHYEKLAAETAAEAFEYLGILLYGNSKKIASLTGCLPLLR